MNWATILEHGLPFSDADLVASAALARETAADGRYGAALEILWNQLITARRQRDLARQAFLFIHIGRVYREWMWDVAREFYGRGLKAAHDSGYTAAELTAHASLGELHQAWGEPARALEHYERCLELAEAEGDADVQHAVLLDMAACRRIQGQPTREQALRDRAQSVQREHPTSTDREVPAAPLRFGEPA